MPRRRAPPLATLLWLVALLFLLAPFAGLALQTGWDGFRLGAADRAAVAVTLGYGLLALALTAALGTPLAWRLARLGGRARALLDAALLLPLLTPPLALGILLAAVYGPYSATGSALGRAGIVLVNTPAAFVLAQVYGALPTYVVTAAAAFEAVPEALPAMALTLGRTRLQAFVEIVLPLAGRGLAAALGLAWVRAVGEFGIVLFFAYFPHGIPVQLYVNLEDRGLPSLYPLLWVFFAVAIPLPLWLGLRARRLRAA